MVQVMKFGKFIAIRLQNRFIWFKNCMTSSQETEIGRVYLINLKSSFGHLK